MNLEVIFIVNGEDYKAGEKLITIGLDMNCKPVITSGVINYENLKKQIAC